ncbi:MAG: hypothetical protein GOMPHAMPRED_004237 [Gomphillus americanus]|uniref:Uncharacterized protein n=1 Tax=Gomphillus americanus TaxID=1940652 RepID=A0A8H3FLN3_9LECA|nr:MAG: hypothetical protein GOMPHAMPRED_004237 [Gomphillus americanus]
MSLQWLIHTVSLQSKSRALSIVSGGMYQSLVTLILLSIAQAFNQSPKSTHGAVTPINTRDVSTGRLFPRSSLKRPAPDLGLSGSQDRNIRQRPGSSSSQQAIQDRNARCPFSQSTSSQEADRNQRLNVSPASSHGREPAGTGRARTPSSPSPNHNQKSQSRQGTSPPASSGPSQLSGNNSGRTYSTSSSQGQSSGSSRERSQISKSQLSGSATTQSQDEFSSVPSSPKRAYPVSVATLTKGPATVTTWEGKSRGGGIPATHIGEGQWRMTDGSNPRKALIATTHHSHTAETYAFGTGQRAGIRTLLHGLTSSGTRITIPRANGQHETHQGGTISCKAATDDIANGAHIMGSFKGQGRFDIEAKHLSTDSDSELEY